MGDTDGDGKVSVTDIIKMQRYLLGDKLDAKGFRNSDLTRDGRVDGFDLALLKRSLLNKN